MEYRDTWDLTTIPADLLMAEYTAAARRRALNHSAAAVPRSCRVQTLRARVQRTRVAAALERVSQNPAQQR